MSLRGFPELTRVGDIKRLAMCPILTGLVPPLMPALPPLVLPDGKTKVQVKLRLDTFTRQLDEERFQH